MNAHRSGLRRLGGILTAAALVAGLAACSGEPEPAPTPSATASPSASPTPSQTPAPSPTPAPELLSPLRGTAVEKAESGPALAAKIDNHFAARPQYGLERTDIVFEELVEGGLTRYVALWFSDVPKEIGPVRSIRPMDPDIISPFGGIVAYSGGKATFVAMMKDTPVHNAIHGGKDNRFMYRTRDKAAPHNVILKAQEIRAAYAEIAPPRQFFAYATEGEKPAAVAAGKETSRIEARFSSAERRSWEWDGKSYLRSQNGRADLDQQGKRLSATNVVTLTVKIDNTYGSIPKTVLVDSGKGTLSTGGKTIEVSWSKKDRNAPIVLTTNDGKPALLQPGNTWVELVPTRGKVTLG